MKVLLVSATELEIAPFMNNPLSGKADVLITGIGVPATIYHVTKQLMKNQYKLVIQAGIAGSFHKSFALGEVVWVKSDCFADIGINEFSNFKTLFEMGLAGENQFPFQKGFLINNSIVTGKFTLPPAIGITVNNITDDMKAINNIQKKFTADIETMEGGAFHYVCLQQQVNFLQIRAISNIVGERNKNKWELKKAIIELDKELIKIFESL